MCQGAISILLDRYAYWLLELHFMPRPVKSNRINFSSNWHAFLVSFSTNNRVDSYELTGINWDIWVFFNVHLCVCVCSMKCFREPYFSNLIFLVPQLHESSAIDCPKSIIFEGRSTITRTTTTSISIGVRASSSFEVNVCGDWWLVTVSAAQVPAAQPARALPAAAPDLREPRHLGERGRVRGHRGHPREDGIPIYCTVHCVLFVFRVRVYSISSYVYVVLNCTFLRAGHARRVTARRVDSEPHVGWDRERGALGQPGFCHYIGANSVPEQQQYALGHLVHVAAAGAVDADRAAAHEHDEPRARHRVLGAPIEHNPLISETYAHTYSIFQYLFKLVY